MKKWISLLVLTVVLWLNLLLYYIIFIYLFGGGGGYFLKFIFAVDSVQGSLKLKEIQKTLNGKETFFTFFKQFKNMVFIFWKVITIFHWCDQITILCFYGRICNFKVSCCFLNYTFKPYLKTVVLHFIRSKINSSLFIKVSLCNVKNNSNLTLLRTAGDEKNLS